MHNRSRAIIVLAGVAAAVICSCVLVYAQSPRSLGDTIVVDTKDPSPGWPVMRDVLREAGGISIATNSDGSALEEPLAIDSRNAATALQQAIRSGRIDITALGSVRVTTAGDDELDSYRRRIQPYAIPSDPDFVGGEIRRLRKKNTDDAVATCRRQSACLTAVKVRFAAEDTFAADIMASDPGNACGKAANAYNQFVHDNCSENGLCDANQNRILVATFGAELDHQCMQPVPAPGATISRATAATALIISRNATHRGPFCTGLFVSPGKVATALHCWGAAARADLDASLVYVVALDHPDDAGWPVARQAIEPISGPPPFDRDMVVVTIVGGPTVQPIVFGRGEKNEKVFVASYFRHFDGANANGATLAAGIRQSRDGLCRVYESNDQCVRVFCQTVAGYSGAPIFSRADRGPNSPLVVYGLISGGEGSDGYCGGERPKFYLTAGPTHVN